MNRFRLGTAFVLALSLVACKGEEKKEEEEKKDEKAMGIPSDVKTAFETEFPGATKVAWTDDEGNFHVAFVLAGQDHEVEYDRQGRLLSSEKQLSENEIPGVILDYLNTHHDGFSLREAEMEKDSSGVTYELKLKDRGQSIELEFNEKGKLLDKDMERNTKVDVPKLRSSEPEIK